MNYSARYRRRGFFRNPAKMRRKFLANIFFLRRFRGESDETVNSIKVDCDVSLMRLAKRKILNFSNQGKLKNGFLVGGFKGV